MLQVEKTPTLVPTYAGLSLNSYAGNLNELQLQQLTPVNVSMLASLRVKFGVYHQASWTGSRTTNFFVYKDGKYYLGEANLGGLILDPVVAQELCDINQRWGEIPYSEDFVSNLIELPYEDLTIPLESFRESSLIQYLFQENVDSYYEFLKEAEIPAFPVATPSFSLVRYSSENFMRPIIMRCTDNWSGLITANADLYSSYGFWGVSDSYSGELVNVELFSKAQVESIHNILQVPIVQDNYSLYELLQLIKDAGFAGMSNGILRFLRTNGSGLPANHDTWR